MSITLPLGLRRDRGDREDQWLLTQPVNQAVIGCELRWPMRPMIFHDLPIFIMVMMVMFHGGLLMIVELWESIWLLSCKETAVHQWVFNTFGFPTSLMVTRNINTLSQNLLCEFKQFQYIQHSSTTYIDLPRSIDLRDGQWKKTVRKLQAFLIGGLEHLFPIYWECHNPNWRTHIFQRGRFTTKQIMNLAIIKHIVTIIYIWY